MYELARNPHALNQMLYLDRAFSFTITTVEI